MGSRRRKSAIPRSLLKIQLTLLIAVRTAALERVLEFLQTGSQGSQVLPGFEPEAGDVTHELPNFTNFPGVDSVLPLVLVKAILGGGH